MADPTTSTTFAGAENQGVQVGYNTGSIHIAGAGKCLILPYPR